jgi:hypothetical protein
MVEQLQPPNTGSAKQLVKLKQMYNTPVRNERAVFFGTHSIKLI